MLLLFATAVFYPDILSTVATYVFLAVHQSLHMHMHMFIHLQGHHPLMFLVIAYQRHEASHVHHLYPLRVPVETILPLLPIVQIDHPVESASLNKAAAAA